MACLCICAVCDFAACDDLVAKENELDRLLAVCTSSITTLTKNVSSTQYPLNYFVSFAASFRLWNIVDAVDYILRF